MSVPLGATAASVGSHRATAWIQSPAFDLCAFILSPLVALPILLLAPAGYSVLALTVGALLGGPHYFSTFAFFFWDETREDQRAQWPIFFLTPAVIAGSIWLMAAVQVPYLIQVAVYVWNTIHVARQSCGILSIYRHRAGVTDPRLKSIVNGAVISTSAAMAFSHIEWYPTLFRFMTLLWSGLPRTVSLFTAAAAVVAVTRLGYSLWRRLRSGSAPSAAELACLVTSLLLFHPYLWVHDASRATQGVLLGHFVQYLGLVWLVHRRKFGAPGARMSPVWLARLSTNLPLLAVTGLGVGLLFLFPQLFIHYPLVDSIFEPWFLSLALVHFYLDGLFWAFKRPEVRRQLGSFLLGPRGQLA